jgi:hypothetical protein
MASEGDILATYQAGYKPVITVKTSTQKGYKIN